MDPASLWINRLIELGQQFIPTGNIKPTFSGVSIFIEDIMIYRVVVLTQEEEKKLKSKPRRNRSCTTPFYYPYMRGTCVFRFSELGSTTTMMAWWFSMWEKEREEENTEERMKRSEANQEAKEKPKWRMKWGKRREKELGRRGKEKNGTGGKRKMARKRNQAAEKQTKTKSNCLKKKMRSVLVEDNSISNTSPLPQALRISHFTSLILTSSAAFSS